MSDSEPIRQIEEALRSRHPEALRDVPKNKRAAIIRGAAEIIMSGGRQPVAG